MVRRWQYRCMRTRTSSGLGTRLAARCRRVLLALAAVSTVAGCAALVPARTIEGQVVRGVVRERDSGAAVPGVVVSLERLVAGGRPDSIVIGLSDASGTFALIAPGPGRYRLSAKRIGVERFTSDSFTLGEGETRRLDVIVARAVVHALPTVTVVANDMCVTNGRQSEQVFALWDEVRTALEATRISERQHLVSARIYRYQRELEPRSLRILDETRTEFTGLVERPFKSLPAETLSRSGYWRGDADAAEYFAPDADVLLSGTFRRDHCFSMAGSRRDRTGMTGLSFEPAPGRNGAEIRGTVWLDARTFELRIVEYAYTGVPREASPANPGGELRFARLPSGAWVVRRWYIRMPQFARQVEFTSSARGVPPEKMETLGLYRVREEGAQVFADGMQFLERPGSIAGVALDSVGKPLSEADVRLAGSPFHVTPGDDGRFRFDSLPSGGYTIVAETPGYSALGMYAADQSLLLDEGQSMQVKLVAPGTREILSRLCSDAPRHHDGVLRLTVLDEATGAPVGSLPIHVYWLEAADGERANGVQSATDGKGTVTFCDVPTRMMLLIRPLLRATGQPAALVARCVLDRGAIAARRVRIRQPLTPDPSSTSGAIPRAGEAHASGSLQQLPECAPIEAPPDPGGRPH